MQYIAKDIPFLLASDKKTQNYCNVLVNVLRHSTLGLIITNYIFWFFSITYMALTSGWCCRNSVANELTHHL